MKAKEILQTLKTVRKAKYINPAQMGEAIGLKLRQLGRYEANTCSPQMNRVIEWADKLGMKIVLRQKNK